MGEGGGGREICWGISCEKSRFYAKKIIFFTNFRGGGGGAPPLPTTNKDITDRHDIAETGFCLGLLLFTKCIFIYVFYQSDV